jgi:hypothetical protein
MSNVPNNVIVNEDTPNQVIVAQDAPNQVVVRLAANGGNTRRHIHDQSAVSNHWIINHTLGGYPSVMVVDTARNVVVGEVTYNSTSQVVVDFSAEFSGYAYLT